MESREPEVAQALAGHTQRRCVICAASLRWKFLGRSATLRSACGARKGVYSHLFTALKGRSSTEHDAEASCEAGDGRSSTGAILPAWPQSKNGASHAPLLPKIFSDLRLSARSAAINAPLIAVVIPGYSGGATLLLRSSLATTPSFICTTL